MWKKLLLGSLVLGAVSGLNAAEPAAAGSILKSQGSVTIEHAGKLADANDGLVLYSGDTIRTGVDGRVQWQTPDDSLFLLIPNSVLRLDEYVPQEKSAPASGKSFSSLLKGAMRSVTGLIAKGNPKNYRVTTPVATMGVRGTDFALTICAGDCNTRSSLLKSSGSLKHPLMQLGKGRLVRTASPKALANGLYLKMLKLTGELCNDGGCQAVTAGQGSGCAYAADSKTKPVQLPECPSIFDASNQDYDFDFDGIIPKVLPDILPFPPVSPS